MVALRRPFDRRIMKIKLESRLSESIEVRGEKKTYIDAIGRVDDDIEG